MAAILDGVDQYFSTGVGYPMITTTPFTMVGWALHDNVTKSGILCSVTDDSNDIHIIQPRGSIDDYNSASSYDGSWSSAVGTVAYDDTTWQHFAGVFTSSTLRACFLDGADKQTNTGSQNPSGMNQFMVGAHKTGGSNYFQGKVTHVAIWDVALTDDEILALAHGALPTSIQLSNLQGYWPLVDDGVDETATRNLTGYNSPTFDATQALSTFILRDWHFGETAWDGSLSSTFWMGHTFTTTSAYTSTKAKLKYYRAGSGETGTLDVSLRATSGGLPTGADLASASIDVTTLTTSSSGAWYEFEWTTPVALSDATQYALIARPSSSAGSVYTRTEAPPTNSGGTLVYSADSGSSWVSNSSYDVPFELFSAGAGTATQAVIELDGAGDFDLSPKAKYQQIIELDGAGDFTLLPSYSNSENLGSIVSTPFPGHTPGVVRHNEGHDPRHDERTPVLFDSIGTGEATDEDRITIPIKNEAGHHRAEIFDHWYEHTHLLPRVVQELGNVVSATSFPVDLYNADRFNDITIVSITDNLDPGVTIVGVPATPFVIKSQDSMAATVYIDTTGGLTIDSSYTFTADDATTYTLYIEGSRIVLLPIRPETPMREHLIFDTKILEATDGTEQRIAMRKTPRSMFEMTIKHDNRRMMEMLLFDRQSKVVACPAWHEPSYLTSDVTVGDYTVNVNTTDYANFYVGGHAIILQDEWTYDALQIASMTATSLTFDSPAATAYSSKNKKIHVMPLMTAWMNSNVAASKNLYNQQTFNIRLDVGSVDQDIADASTWSTFDSKVFLDDPNMVEGNILNEALETKVLVVDNMTGVFDRVTQWARNKRSSVKGFKSNTREELWILRQLFHYLKAQQVSFYIPTFSKDLIPNTTLLNTQSLFVMDNIGYTINARNRPSKDWFRMHLKDGTILTRQILISTEASASEEQLTVDVAWPYDIDPDDIERCEFLEKVRINVDDIVITHYNALGQAKCFVPTKEVFD